MAVVLDAILAAMRRRRPHARGPWLAGLSGLPGSGKSTLAHPLARAARGRGVRTEVLSLDDFYLGRRARLRLANDVHPLLATRGVPGTHDLGLLRRTLAGFARASARRPVALPRFDKGRDTRVPPSHWRRVVEPPRLVVLEGWCVGVPAQSAGASRTPVNALERDEDRDGRWRRLADAQLAGAYAALWRRLDQLVLLEAPDWAVVARWRGEQECRLRERGAARAMDAPTLRRFLMHYERIGRHALRELPRRAGVRIELRRDRSVRRIVVAT